MTADTKTNYVFSRSFVDVDDLAEEARHWSLEFRQLQSGRFQGDVLQFGSQDVHVAKARFRRSLHQQGEPPAGMRTVAVMAEPSARLLWRGKSIDGQSLMVFPRGSELSSVSGGDFHVYTCSFPEELLSGLSESLEIADLESLCRGAEAIRSETFAMKKLRRCLAGLCRSAEAEPASLSNASFMSRLTSQLPIDLLRAIAAGTGHCPPASCSNRLAALERAESFIARFAGTNLKVRDICQAAGVSERTLEYAFLERFGIGPKEYLRAFRLTSARRQLRNSDPLTTKVTDVANEWGFWHMGQFAADYRAHFEELPSETLHSGIVDAASR